MKFLNDVRLGVQVHGGVQYQNWSALPLQERTLNYLQQPVQGSFSHTMPYYGVGMALRARGAEMAVSYRAGNGVQSDHWVPFQDGSNAIPYRPKYSRWTVRGQYFVLDWVGIGVSYQNQLLSLRQSLESEINGEIVNSHLFSASTDRQMFSIYVPLQLEIGRIRLVGRLESKIAGTADSFYSASFVRYQSSKNLERQTTVDPEVPTRFDKSDQPLRHQSAKVGAEVPLWGGTVHPSVGIERMHVPDYTTLWSYDVQVEIGLPF